MGAIDANCQIFFPRKSANVVDREVTASAHFISGVVGALITAIGIPIASRRKLAMIGFLGIKFTGGVAAALVGSPPAGNPYKIHIFWQAAVAAAIGRSIK